MIFKVLTDYFSLLEKTSKRLELIQLLADLFKKVEEQEEIKQVAYLVQGRVAAFYEPIEFGMGEKMLERVVAEGTNQELVVVQKLNKEQGDVGLTVERLKQDEHIDANRLTIEQVFKQLVKLSEISGEGSQENKVSLLSDLLKQISGEEAKYLLRIVSGRLRLGIGDPSVLEALSLARLEDKKYRKELEKVYNEISDLGEIAEHLWKGNDALKALEKVKQMGIEVGRPLRSQLCERLPSSQATVEKMGLIACQFKYDGFRTQMHLDRKTGTVRLFSRNLEETTKAFPDLIQGIFDQIEANSVILDSEALAYHTESEEFFPFQETTKRRRKHGIEEMAEKLPLRAFVFDILYKNGESLVELPVTERLKILKETIKGRDEKEEGKVDTLIVSETRMIDQAEPLGLMLEEALTKGLEGLVVKKVNSPYEAGARNYNWVKLKHTASEQLKDTVDCVILGYILGRGKRASFGAGALLVGVYDREKDLFVSISKIGTGLSDEEWISIKERTKDLVRESKPARVESEIEPSVWVEPKVVIEVLADEITRSPSHTTGRDEKGVGYALRFPRLISFRESDKSAEDATDVEEIIKLYNLQKFK